MSRGRGWPLPALLRRPVVPVVRLSGVIGGSGPLRDRLNLAAVAKGLDRAFGMRSAAAVALIVNSPGGSPVQAHLIYRRIRDLAAEKKKPVIVFVEDVAASGGYMVALAGDEIIADRHSIIGSIGVVSAGFGFTGLMERLGVERRIHTAGKSKAMLDPFRPEKREDLAHLAALQKAIHESFIALVRERRPRLAEGADLFDGTFWLAPVAKDYGLIDRLGDVRAEMRERYGSRVRLPVIGAPRGFRRRWLGGTGAGFAAGAVDAAAGVLEDHAWWKRYGL